MRLSAVLILVCLTAFLASMACVDQIDQSLTSTVNVIVVDGTITDVAESIIIRLNRSLTDQLTGQAGTLPITKATVEVVVDSSLVVACHETVEGSYQLPNEFRGQVGHTYQLRFTLSDGTPYQSTPELMPAAPPIEHLTAQFNLTSVLPPFADNTYTAGHDLFITVQDPVDQHNYYRWDWRLYEPQEWCRSCYEGIYAINTVIDLHNGTFKSTNQPLEDCFYPPTDYKSVAYSYVQGTRFDYHCRTQCWEIIHSHDLNMFEDRYSNGGLIARRPVAHIPFYQHSPCLVDIRQAALTKEAYQYFSAFQQQTQNTGGLADTPPTVLAGNVRNRSNSHELVIGYFTASGVVVKPYYIDRKDTQGIPPTLFYALNGRIPNPESPPPPNPGPTFIVDGPARPPTAVCAPVDQRTPFKPVGWPN